MGVRELPVGLVRCRRLATLGSCPGDPPEMGAPPLVALDGLGLLGRLVQLEKPGGRECLKIEEGKERIKALEERKKEHL